MVTAERKGKEGEKQGKKKNLDLDREVMSAVDTKIKIFCRCIIY